jgi:hypothetical protein
MATAKKTAQAEAVSLVADEPIKLDGEDIEVGDQFEASPKVAAALVEAQAAHADK